MAKNAAIEKGLEDNKESSVKAVKDRAVKNIEQGVETAQETITDVANQANDELQKLTASGTKFVRENPGAAVAGAVGVGILIGLALRGRDY